MPSLSLDRLEKRFGEHRAVASVSLAIRDGEFVSLLGPSGCGKTTILRMVAGLVEPSSGRVLIDDRDVTREPPNRRRIGLVFQSYALFPHMTVFDNVAFGLRRQGVAEPEVAQRVRQALGSVRLQGFDDRRPQQLSGGQQQRVAVARSIAPRPSILLFDEPLSNLDAALRDEMQIELKRLQREVGITTIFVTHDQTEALSMSDRVCVLADGRVQQFDTPENVYHRPATGFVARFIGRPNRLRGRLAALADPGGDIEFDGGLRLRARRVPPLQPGSPVDVVLRQEDLSIVHQGQPGTVSMRSFVGARVQYVVAMAGGVELIVETPTNGPHAGLEVGQPVQLAVDPAHVHVSATATAP